MGAADTVTGYIDNVTGEALWTTYNGGRVTSGAQIPEVHHYAQWSSVLDKGTCDWCRWADNRIFDTDLVSYTPPMHWGCRCIIAHIKRSEPKATLDWGSGPPKSSWPPGSKGGKVKGAITNTKAGKKVKEVSESIKRSAQTWKRRWKDKWGINGKSRKSSATSGENYTSMKNWERDAIVTAVGGDRRTAELMVERLDSFIRSWTASSGRDLKKLGELMARGSPDDLLKFIQSPDGRYITSLQGVPWDRSMAARYIQVWDAHKDLAAETARLSNLVGPDGKITLYRGVKATNKSGTNYAAKQAIQKGDLDHSIGTSFIESWSTDAKIGRDFAGNQGMVFVKKIDPEDVFAHWQEHANFSSYIDESEVIWYNWDGTIVPKSAKRLKPGTGNTTMEVEVF